MPATSPRSFGLIAVASLLAVGTGFFHSALAEGKPRGEPAKAGSTASPLAWASERVELRPGVEAYLNPAPLEARFVFTNAGKTPWEIVSVEPDCGCTAAMATKPTIGPGESGEVLARFSVAERTGRQEKHLLVRAREASGEGPGEAVARLTLVVHLPDLVRITPAKLSWTLGETAVPKTLLVEAAMDEMPIEHVTARSTQALFRADVRTVEPGRRYKVTVQPSSTEILVTGHLPISCQFAQAPLASAEKGEKTAPGSSPAEKAPRLFVVIAAIVPPPANATATTTPAAGAAGR